MFLATTVLEQISEAHLQRLIADGVREGRDLDFKRDGVGDDSDSKREFLKDVISFANTVGGHLIVGMDESSGVASALNGLTSRPPDDEKLRLENLVRDGVEPRLVGIRIHEVPLTGGGYVLVIRIPPSWNPPHRIGFRNSNRFFARNSAGAYELSVEQLRSVFLGGADLERRIQDFRFERLARLDSGQKGLAVAGRGRFVLHIIPVGPQAGSLDLPLIKSQPMKFLPLRAMSTSWRFTFDGLVFYAVPDAGTEVPAYTHVFHDGRIETVQGGIIIEVPIQEAPRLSGSVYQLLFRSTRAYLEGLVAHGIAPPFVILASLVDILGSILPHPPYSLSSQTVDRDALLFEPIFIEELNFHTGWEAVFRPVLDSLWNAYGYGRCHAFFDDDGNWMPQRQ